MMTDVRSALQADAFKQEKASWYREVLALEPGSKIFLSYSRLLAELGDISEAVKILRGGLDKHPEYTEARLFLVNLLHQTGDHAQCGAEVARLAGLFTEYPDFWEAWSSFAASQGDRDDLSVSLGILGTLIQNENITILDVLSTGLKTMHGESFAPAGSATKNTNPPAKPAVDELAIQTGIDLSGEDPGEEAGAGELAVEELKHAPDPVTAALPFVFGANEQAEMEIAETQEPAQEKCSLQTRSMAEVLAEQGDYRGAVDIYEELLAVAEPGQAEELEARLHSLRARMGDEEWAPVRVTTASSSQKDVRNDRPQNGMLELLEKLAGRLEMKSRQ